MLAALITTVGSRLARVETKIDGLRNGTYEEAIAAVAELQREREELRIMGIAPRRVLDHMVSEPARAQITEETP